MTQDGQPWGGTLSSLLVALTHEELKMEAVMERARKLSAPESGIQGPKNKSLLSDGNWIQQAGITGWKFQEDRLLPFTRKLFQ